MSTQDPYGTSDQPHRTGSSASGSPGSQPSWQQQAPAAPQQGYQQPAPYQDAPPAQGGYPAYAGQGGYDRPAPKNGVGLAALILGILGLVGILVFGLGGLLGLVAVILGFIGVRRVKRGEATNRGAAITGIVLGLISVVLGIVVLIGLVFLGSKVSDCATYLQNGDQAGYQTCIENGLGAQGATN
ncbi:DUF4190 domain-containing protein [Quadrisphaera oryzae]|uniref:DUF4190 domain-containing protein n=1 Tax=Quadrisphaera TaxID=317661 RepID=UPI001C96B51A